MQNNMIKNLAGNDAKIISPWHYGHHGENAMFYKTFFFGYRESLSGSCVFYVRHMISVTWKTHGSGNYVDDRYSVNVLRSEE